MNKKDKDNSPQYPTQLLTDVQFKQLLARMPKQPQQPSAIGKLLSGSANIASKLVSVHGKKLSMEGKIVRKDLYFGQKMTELVNPLGVEIERPMQLYSIPRRKIMPQSEMRQKLNFFGVSKLRLF
jgi:hypothetical protein